MKELDLKKELKHLYSPSSKRPVIVEVPEMKFLMIDGSGNPNNSKRFQNVIETLYPLAYSMKFGAKKELEVNYPVMAMEGIYWGTPKGLTRFTDEDKEKWSWTLMMMVPDIISEEFFKRKRSELIKKKNPPLIDEARLERFHEGAVVQQMHIGPYDTEWQTVEPMHTFAEKLGYELTGKHHEIYIGDPRRSAPEKLRTIVRHPITPKI